MSIATVPGAVVSGEGQDVQSEPKVVTTAIAWSTEHTTLRDAANTSSGKHQTSVHEFKDIGDDSSVGSHHRRHGSKRRMSANDMVMHMCSSHKLHLLGTMDLQTGDEKEDLLEDMQKDYEILQLKPNTVLDYDKQDPFLSMTAHFKRLLTPARLAIAFVFTIITVVGVALVDREEFKIKVTVPNVNDLAGCTAICMKTLTDSDFANTLGGNGVCSTVDFSECNLEAKYPKLKAKSCDQITSTSAVMTKEVTRCRFMVEPDMWKPYVTMVVFVLAAEGCFSGGPPDILLVGAGCILCLAGVITRSQLFAGLTNSGVLGLAVLSPIAFAIGESGIMEQMVGFLLGSPSSLGIAIPRMMLPVALLSAFLSNTATVAILIPIIVSWSRRLEVHPGKLLMPLSFAAQLGGSMTLLGSSHCLVAQGAIPSSVYDMQFFDLFPIGALLTVLTAFVIWIAATKTTLLRSSAEIDTEITKDDFLDVYDMPFVVTLGGVQGKTIEQSGLERLPGVVKIKHPKGDQAILHQGDILSVICTERGVVQLRKVPGLILQVQQHLSALGRQRHHRFLYEVGVRPGSQHFARGIPKPEDLRHDFAACFIAGPKRCCDVSCPADLESHAFEFDPTENCVLLLEADERAVSSKQVWTTEFTLVHRVHASSPPRQGLPVDKIRSTITFLGFIALIALVTVKVVKLDYGGGILCIIYLLIRALTPAQFSASFSPSILGTIVGALAMGIALQRSGVVNFIANAMISAAEPMGKIGITIMIYIVAWVMGLVINNSAIVAILGPMLISVTDKDPSLNIKGLVWALVYGAGTCFKTPLGYQTNLMVIPQGKYTFADFARFGGAIQFVHFLLVVLLIQILAPALE